MPRMLATAPAQGAQAIRPPMEAVLPRFAYGVLVAELVGLVLVEQRLGTQPWHMLGMVIGWVGTASMILMHVYSIRRRVRALSRWGKLSRWLQLHIFLGLQGALLVTFHSLHLSTLSNLSGVTFVLTLIVVMSGIFGRYMFSMLPKGIAGERLGAKQVEAELAELLPLVEPQGPQGPQGKDGTPALRAALAELAQPVTVSTAPIPFLTLVSEDRKARRALRALNAAIAEARKSGLDAQALAALDRTAAAARRRAMLRRRLATLSSAERMFRGWTILHRPLTFLLFGSVALHVLAHYLFASAYSS